MSYFFKNCCFAAPDPNPHPCFLDADSQDQPKEAGSLPNKI